MSKVNVMTKEKDEEQLADILLFTVAIKSLVTYRKVKKGLYPVGKVRKEENCVAEEKTEVKVSKRAQAFSQTCSYRRRQSSYLTW